MWTGGIINGLPITLDRWRATLSEFVIKEENWLLLSWLVGDEPLRGKQFLFAISVAILRIKFLSCSDVLRI